MEKQQELIRTYFQDKGIAFTEQSYGTGSYHAHFSAQCRLRDCRVQLTPDPSELQINITLPIRVMRSEAYDLCREIALINEEMPENAGYFIEPITGSLQMIVRMAAPQDAEQLEAKLNGAVSIAEEDVDTLLDSLSEIRLRIKKQAEEAERKKREAEIDAEIEAEMAAEARASQKNPLDRLLSFIGLMNPDELEDAK